MVTVYLTTADQSQLFARDRSRLMFARNVPQSGTIISLDASERFQTIDGFGLALSGSSVSLLRALPDRGAAIVDELFGVKGIGVSYVRVSIGASDFSLGSYTYDDVPAGRSDPQLTHFSVIRDAGVFAVMRSIHTASPGVRFMASPWTAPAWMKSGAALDGGALRQESYGPYAGYLISYVRALERRGIRLDALTLQNEPAVDNAGYPSMTLSATGEATLIRRELGPRLSHAFPAVKLLVGDQNWDAAYPLAVLGANGAARYIRGSAFHCYAGDEAAMSIVHRAYPAKDIDLDECSGGGWSTGFGANLAWDIEHLVIGGARNWARTVLFGNLALDDRAGPVNGGCPDCRGVLTIHRDGSLTRNVEYYVLAQTAKFVRPGAVRIGSSGGASNPLANVAFRNTDGSTVLIVLNRGPLDAAFTVRAGERSFGYTLPSGAVATFTW